MKSALERAAGFDPPRDIDRYLEDDAAYLRRRGLTRPSIELYVLLCRLCEPGQSRLVYAYQSDLVAVLRRMAPNARGMTESGLSRKLGTLSAFGFLAKAGGGLSDHDLVIELRSPETVAQTPARPRRPRVATPESDRQPYLFAVEPEGIRLFVPSDEPSSEPADQELQLQPIAVSGAELQSVAVAVSNSTLYPRAPAVEDEVEDEDESTDEGCARQQEELAPASRPVTQAEAATAAAALRQVEARWKRAGLRPPKDPDQLAEDRSILRRAHVLLQRGLIPEAAWAEAIGRPVEQRARGRRVARPYAMLTKRLFQVRGFGRLLGSVREPIAARPADEHARTRASPPPMTSAEFLDAAAAAGIRLPLPEASPNGEHVQRE